MAKWCRELKIPLAAGLLNNEKNPDPAWLVYILDQFIGNALKYGQRKGEVWKKRAETEAAKPGDVEPEEVEPGRQQAQEEEKPGENAPCLRIWTQRGRTA